MYCFEQHNTTHETMVSLDHRTLPNIVYFHNVPICTQCMYNSVTIGAITRIHKLHELTVVGNIQRNLTLVSNVQRHQSLQVKNNLNHASYEQSTRGHDGVILKTLR